jgi:peroxiredoxin
MVRTLSTMLPLGTAAPDFSLPDTDGKIVSLAQFVGKKGLLVAFLCNHCPFVKHVADELKKIGDECLASGIGVVGISSNDIVAYPDDAPEKMKEEKALRGYAFPYLFDETQSVAKAYHAACTPDFFLFDGAHKLVYRGQMDESRPKSDKPVTGKDLRMAIDTLLKGQPPLATQTPSLGCNIKWIEGSEPTYFNPAS